MAGFKSFLSAAGHDFLKVFSFLGSAKGQQVVAGTESAVDAVVGIVDPALSGALLGIQNLFNAGLQKALSIEASAAAVGAQSGTGAQKAAAVIAGLTPQVASFLTSIGIKNPTAAQAQTLATALNNGVVSFLNAVPAPSSGE